jgi:hypothetical protein
MAYFAELDSENIVIKVEIVDDSLVQGTWAENEAWCEANLTHSANGVAWKQTFMDSTTRGIYANGDNIIYRSADWEGHATADKFVQNLPQAWASVMKLSPTNYFVPIIDEPTVDDQGRSIPYDPNNFPEDALAWGFEPDNNRWAGSRSIDGTIVHKYYDPNTQTWINV